MPYALRIELPAGARHQELGEQWHRAAGRTLFAPGFPGGAGDVQMRPFELPGKTRKKACGGNAAAGTAADVRHVGEIALELLLIIFPGGHMPHPVPGRLSRRDHFVRKTVIVGEPALNPMAPCDDAATG